MDILCCNSFCMITLIAIFLRAYEDWLFSFEFQVMKAHNCFQLVFSSSCCVYGNPERLPITEDSPIGNVTNVYGRTKYIIEEMLMDLSRSDDVISHHK